MTNYVKFLRGTPSAFAALETKDKDTLYFISTVDATVGKLYLGDTLIAGNVTPEGDSIVDSLGELIDVNLAGLVTGQVLGYDGAEWVPMTLPEVVEVSEMTGATATKDGSAGLVPVPKAGEQNKFLRGDGTWQFVNNNLPKYKITSGLFEDTLVDYRENEIRLLFAENSSYVLQQVGPTGNANYYYIGFKAYAPDAATHFKEDTAETIRDNTLHDFNGDFSGIDADGRKYSIVWLAVASYDANTNTWTYLGEKSTVDKYIGWFYTVEWYNGDKLIGTDTIRINLANKNCFNNNKDYYMSEYAKKDEIVIKTANADIFEITEDKQLELKAVPQNIVTGLTKTSWTVQEVEDGDDIFIAQTTVGNLEDILKPATFDPTTKTGTSGLMTAEQVQKLQALVITDEGIQVSGKVNADNVEGLASWITSNRETISGLYPVEAENLLNNLNTLVTDDTNGLNKKINEQALKIAKLEEANMWGEL